MRVRPLGRSGLRVSELCLGTMTFGMAGWGCDEAEALRISHRFFAAGGNFVDTADLYAGTLSEEIVGKAIAGRRTEVVVATKCTMPVGSGPNDRGSSRKHVREACDASLRRLGTDYIDLYQIHAEDLWTPLDETLAGLEQLVQAGKVLYLGVSNYRAYRLMKALSLSDARGWSRFVSFQPQYNLLVRSIEREHFPLCREEGVGIITWSPLAAGMLSGKIPRGERPPDTRLGQRDMEFYRAYFTDRAHAVVDVVRTCAREVGCTPAQLAIAWQLAKPEISAVILGVRTMAQLEDDLGAAAVDVPPAVMARLDDASALEPEYPDAFLDMIQRWLGTR